MMTRSSQRLSVWLTLAALLGAAIPSGAQELYAAGEVRLNLEETVDLAIMFPERDPHADRFSAAVSSAPRPAPLPDLSQATASEAWTSLQQQTQAAEAQAKPKRGFGRWLKKHWYVPVLVAGAIGVAAASGGDDDSSGEDD